MANKLYSYKDRLSAALGVALRRQYSIPLDVSSIFLSLADFQAYVKQDKTYTPKGDAEDIKFFQDIVPYSYPGQIISVIDETTQTSDVYVINKVGPLESNEKIETRYTKLNGGGPGAEYIKIIEQLQADVKKLQEDVKKLQEGGYIPPETPIIITDIGDSNIVISSASKEPFITEITPSNVTVINRALSLNTDDGNGNITLK